MKKIQRGIKVKNNIRRAAAILLILTFVLPVFTACSVDGDEVTDSNIQNPTQPAITLEPPRDTTAALTTGETEPIKVTTEPSEPAVTETEEPVEEETLYTIKTEYCDLKFPEKWQPFVNALSVEEDPYTVAFSYLDGTRLFDIVFGYTAGTFLGTIKSNRGTVPVYYVGYELDKENVGYYDQLGIQDSANVIFQNLKLDYEYSEGYAYEDPANAEYGEVFAIPTSFATLYYPKKWEDAVTVSVEDKTASFSYGDTAIFDILFKECDGAFLGTYAGTPVYAISYDVDSDAFTAEQYRDICAMQDDINVILEYLKKDDKFE